MSSDPEAPYSSPQFLTWDGIPVDDACYGFHVAGEDFLVAAKAYSPLARQRSFVVQFLCCQSVELSLKAFLSLKGMNQRQFKALGHNLHLLFAEALRHGIADVATIESTDTATLHAFNGWYDMPWIGPARHFGVRRFTETPPGLAAIEELASRLQSGAVRAVVVRGRP